MKKLTYSTCSCCGELLRVKDSYHKRYLNQDLFETIHFCNEECHNQWLLGRIRRNET